ncbi:MAG: hypothetical protein FWC94_00030 [Bacteroidales bacterium]|nr:hypothetical protein [Bacteroidales bacterium]
MKIVLKFKTIFLSTLILTLTSVTSAISAQTTNVYMGLRLPQMSSQQRANIGAEANPQQARGQMIFNTDSGALQHWSGIEWVTLSDHESILDHIVNNITQEFIDSIMAGVTIASSDETIKIVRVGASHIDLSVNITTIADSLIHNAWFVESLIKTLFENNNFIDSLVNNLVNNTTFITDLVNNEFFISELVTNNQFIDSIVNNLVNNEYFIENLVMNQQFIDSIVNNLVNNETFITELVNNEYFIENLVTNNQFIDSIVNNLTTNQTFIDSLINNIVNDQIFLTEIVNNLSMNITEDFVDSIMAKVSITGSRGVVVTGSGTSNITVMLPEGQIEGEVLTWDNTLQIWRPAETASVVRQLVIPVQNGNFTTENLIFYGVTSTAINPLQVVNIEPVFSNNQMRRTFLSVDASVTVESNAAEWSVSIENRNFIPTNQFSLTSVIISYISSDVSALTSDSQGFIQILGF